MNKTNKTNTQRHKNNPKQNRKTHPEISDSSITILRTNCPLVISDKKFRTRICVNVARKETKKTTTQ